MSNAYTLDNVQSLTPTIENYMLLEEQLEYISYMTKWHHDEEDKIRRKQSRIPEKHWGSDRYGVLVYSARHHINEYLSLEYDYKKFSQKKKEIESILKDRELVINLLKCN